MDINIPKEFSISETPTPEEMERISEAVENHKRTQTQGEYDLPGVDIKLVMKDAEGVVQGGVTACTIYRVMHLDVLWVAEASRGQGYGSQLVLGAENIGFKKGCITSQTWTFSFQGPEFYPTIGYKQIGVYDGYPNQVTEHAFMKRFNPDAMQGSIGKSGLPDKRGFTLCTEVSEEDEEILHEGLMRHVKAHVGDEDKTSSIKLTIKDDAGDLIGGLFAWTTLSNLIFEHLWIEEGYRGIGLGRRLMHEMERIARQRSCIASQASSFSFQSPGFFEKMGYQILGDSCGYPNGSKEYYLIKKYSDHKN